jgi:zona occludens toxin (predicted ATPase)
MSITIWTGRPGTGKTLSMVRAVEKLLNKGEIIYSNFRINWSGYDEASSWWRRFLHKIKLKKELKKFPASNLRGWTHLHELKDIKEAYIVIDEAHFYMNSRKWKELPMEFMRKVAQHRKDGLHIYGTVQNIKRIDVVVRELVDFWYECSIFLGFVFNVEYDIDEDQLKKKPLSQKFFRLNKKWASNTYDTLEKIGE